VVKASLELSSKDNDTEAPSHGEQALRDAEDIFGSSLDIKSKDLLDGLAALEDAPWSTFNNGKAVTGKQLSDLLKPFGIRPQAIRHGEKVDKGYKRSDFKDAWDRYRLPPETSVTPVTAVTPVTDLPSIAGVTSRLEDFEEILMG
jgi:Protein of unknown function (DUF3631)